MDPRRGFVGEGDDRASGAGGVGAAFEEALGFEGEDPAVDGGGGGGGRAGEPGLGQGPALEARGVEGEKDAPAWLGGEEGAEPLLAEPAGGDQGPDVAGRDPDPAPAGDPALLLRLGRADQGGAEPERVPGQKLQLGADILPVHQSRHSGLARGVSV